MEGKRGSRTENVCVDFGDGLVPDLPEHVHASALRRVQPVLRGEVPVAPTKSLLIGDNGNLDGLRWVGLGNQEDDVSVVRRPILRVGGNPLCMDFGVDDGRL